MPIRMPSWLGWRPGCIVEAHSPGFDFYSWLNALDYSVLVVVDTVITSKFGSPWRVWRTQPWKVPRLSKKEFKTKVGISVSQFPSKLTILKEMTISSPLFLVIMVAFTTVFGLVQDKELTIHCVVLLPFFLGDGCFKPHYDQETNWFGHDWLG